MSDVLKWGILIAVFAIVFTSITVFVEEMDLEKALEAGTTAVKNGASVISPYLVKARRILNNFFVPEILTCCLYVAFYGKLIQLLIKPILAIDKWIYK